MKTAIMGFGNPVRSDDAIGIYVIEELKKIIGDNDIISILDMGTAAFEVLFGLKGHQKIILVDDFRLRGCQSVVYFAAERDEADKITFMAQSDAAIVQGLVALLLRVYSGRNAKEIRETEPEFLTKIGLDSHLSATRKNGLASMLNAIKSAAAE